MANGLTYSSGPPSWNPLPINQHRRSHSVSSQSWTIDLLGIASMFIAAKVEENYGCQPTLHHLCDFVWTLHTAEDIVQAERSILCCIDWRLHFSNPVNFLQIFNSSTNDNINVLILATSIVEVAVQDWKLVSTHPSLLALASLWLARVDLGFHPWVRF
jgi:Cyclin, N-terminal domain/Cyclin, C-terminal domain